MGAWWTAITAIVVAAVLVAGGVALAKAPDSAPAKDKPKAETYFARVGDDGTQAVLVASRGVTSVSVLGTTPDTWPEYRVTFKEPVAACGWTVSQNPSWGGPEWGWGTPLVGLVWDNTVDPMWNQTPDPHVLRVQLLAADGTTQFRIGDPEAPDEHVIQTFTVVATC